MCSGYDWGVRKPIASEEPMTQRVLPIPATAPATARFPAGDLLRRLTPFNVVVGCPDEVEEYLTAHPDLRSALDGICAKLRESFGPDVELALEVYADPEFEDRYLALYVRQSTY